MQHESLLEQTRDFIEENKYTFDPEGWNVARCIDGRYAKKADLAPLAKPGADIGDLMMLLSTNNEYQLGFTAEMLFNVFIEVIGGWKNFRAHTDTHHNDPAHIFFGDSYFHQAFVDPEAFSLTKVDMEYIHDLLESHEKDYEFTVLEGDHEERAVVIVKSKTFSIYPQRNTPFFQAYIYQKTLDNKRRRLLAQHLLPHIPLEGIQFTEEYLYEVMSQVADNQFLEIINRLAKTLPIFDASIDSQGVLELIEQ